MKSLQEHKGKTGKELLLAVKEIILAEPKRLNMGSWLTAYEGDDAPACGTIGCIAGWAVLLHNAPSDFEKFTNIDNMPVQAMKLLHINHDEAAVLFYASRWPEPFFSNYFRQLRWHDIEGKARITAARIDDFVAKYYQEENNARTEG